MFRARALLFFGLWFSAIASPPFIHAQPGQTALPTGEDDIESELQEDDGSFVPGEATTTTTDALPESTTIAPHEEQTKPTRAAEPIPKAKAVVTADDFEKDGKTEKIFDWNKHKGETEVEHPFAEKGLIRISKDRSYYYKVKESDQTKAFSVHFGMYDPINLSNPDTPDSPYASFESNYEQSSNPAVLFEMEWQGWHSALGKFGLRLGSGFFVAQGHGHFVSPDATLEPRENFTFIMMPNTLGAVYRMQFKDKQWFVPYAEGGGVAFTFSEIRDDDKGPKFGGALGAYGAAGVAFNLTAFDYMTRLQLDREYGINSCYLTAEYRRFQAITTRFDFSSDYINGGFLMEY